MVWTEPNFLPFETNQLRVARCIAAPQLQGSCFDPKEGLLSHMFHSSSRFLQMMWWSGIPSRVYSCLSAGVSGTLTRMKHLLSGSMAVGLKYGPACIFTPVQNWKKVKQKSGPKRQVLTIFGATKIVYLVLSLFLKSNHFLKPEQRKHQTPSQSLEELQALRCIFCWVLSDGEPNSLDVGFKYFTDLFILILSTLVKR